jgi:ATPase family associated with various cellular activities (AAA)
MTLSLVIVIIASTLTIIWSFVFLLPSIFGFRLYRIEGNKLRAFYSKVSCASVWSEDEIPDQWVLGFLYIGYIHTQQLGNHGGQSRALYLFTTTRWFKNNVLGIQEEEKNDKIVLHERMGDYWHLHYEKRLQTPPTWIPFETQLNAMSHIMTLFLEQDSVTCLLYGPPNSGKSNIPLLLAREMLNMYTKVSFVDTYNPSDPGDCFASMYCSINPNKEHPLIIVLEEVDGLILKMHRDEIKPHEHHSLQIRTKSDWNKWLDRFGRNYYPHTILLLTSNQSPEWFDSLDRSYLRENRVNLKIKVPLVRN